jgi:hypothetical protein
MRHWRRLARTATLLAAAWNSGCGDKETELLVAYSGDCQAYIEPCG